jgi:hypothetical protein
MMAGNNASDAGCTNLCFEILSLYMRLCEFWTTFGGALKLGQSDEPTKSDFVERT